MSEVHDEFEATLQGWRRRYAEMARLFLLAPEREQLVPVGHRETIQARKYCASAAERSGAPPTVT